MFELLKKMLVHVTGFGFAAGLPCIILITTSSAWLKDAGVSLSYIGFFAWLTLAYSIKFLWAPLLTDFRYLFKRFLVHRKSWIVNNTINNSLFIFILSLLNPQFNLSIFCLLHL